MFFFRKSLETYGHQSLLRRRELHPQAAQIRAIHSPDGIALHESARHASGAQGHVLFAHHRCQEEPELGVVHVVGRDDQGHGHRGEHQRARSRDPGWQGGVGQVRPGHQQSRERRMCQCCSTCLECYDSVFVAVLEFNVCKIKVFSETTTFFF